ncbi:MAG: carbohydrate kinase family protein [Desulfovibrionaceae bacterium]
MNIYVSGSLAFDRIMTFPGKFSDHILPDKIHILNVCFLVDGLDEKCGGTAGNIAYNLAMLDEKPVVLAAVGKDFGPYRDRMLAMGLPVSGIRVIDGEFTAGAYITTDQSDNQITGFNPGAMKHRSRYTFPDVDPTAKSIAILSPGNASDMMEYAEAYRQMGIPFIFDPGQQIPVFTGQQLIDAIRGSFALVTNDYELEMVLKATGLSRNGLLALTGALITTLGEKGSVIAENSSQHVIPPATINRNLDPTGAGDAYRAGLLKGLALGKSLPAAGRLGSVCAAYCVEQRGTQEHSFTSEAFWQRVRENFGDL